MKRIQCIVQESEIGAGTRGSSLGFAAMKIASLKAGSNFFAKYPQEFLPNRNDLLLKYDDSPSAKNIEGMKEVYQTMVDGVSSSIGAGNFPLLISADHCSAGGTIAGIKKAFPEKRLGVVWVDAHADLHTPWTSPTGNMHGMPLATALCINNENHARRTPEEAIRNSWDELVNLAGLCPKVLPEDMLFFAVRDTERQEDALMTDMKMRNFRVEELRERGFQNCLEEAAVRFNDVDIIYLSFDVDSMDCDLVSHGTGTPVTNGLSPDEASQILNFFARDERLVCMETVEINPTLDEKKNLMAETAFAVLEDFTTELNKQ